MSILYSTLSQQKFLGDTHSCSKNENSKFYFLLGACHHIKFWKIWSDFAKFSYFCILWSRNMSCLKKTVFFTHFRCHSSCAFFEKPNEQINRKLQKCWFWVQKSSIYPTLTILWIFLNNLKQPLRPTH